MAIKISQQNYEKKFGTPVAAITKPTQQPSFLNRVGTDIKNAGSQLGDIFSGRGQFENQSIARKATAAVSTGFHVPMQIAHETLPGFARKGLEKLGNVASQGINKTTNALSETSLFKDPNAAYLNSSGVQNPYNKLEDKLGTVANAGNIAGDILSIGAGAKGIQKVADTTGKIAASTVNNVAPTVGRTMKHLGEKAYGVTVTPQTQTRLAMQAYQAKQPTFMGRVKNMLKGNEPEGKPITESNTAARQGLAGTEWEIGVQAKRAADNLWSSNIQPKLAQVKGVVKMEKFLSSVEKEIRKTPDLTRRNQLLTALDSVKNDYSSVRTPINLEKLQSYKEGWAKFLPDSAYQGKPIAASLKEVHDIMASKARKVIYSQIGEEGKQAYLDYGNLKSIMDAGIKSVGDPAKRSLGRNVWELVMDKAVTPIATVSGKYLYKTGEGLEFFGPKGAKTIRDVVEGVSGKDITPGVLTNIEAKIKNSRPNIGLSTQDVNLKQRELMSRITDINKQLERLRGTSGNEGRVKTLQRQKELLATSYKKYSR